MNAGDLIQSNRGSATFSYIMVQKNYTCWNMGSTRFGLLKYFASELRPTSPRRLYNLDNMQQNWLSIKLKRIRRTHPAFTILTDMWSSWCWTEDGQHYEGWQGESAGQRAGTQQPGDIDLNKSLLRQKERK